MLHPARTIARVELAGGVLLLMVVALTLVSAQVNGRDAIAQVGALGVAAAGYVLGRELNRLGPFPVAVTAFALAAAIGLVTFAASWSGPDAGSLGYTNASAALAVQGAAAAGLAVVLTQHRGARVAGALLCVLLCLVPVAVGAQAAAACAVVVLATTAVAATRDRIDPRGFAAWAALAAAGAVLATIVMGISGRGPGVLESVLTPRRIELWTLAVDTIVDRPLLGVGPGGYDAISIPLFGDQDARPAHSLLLNIAAETGVLAALLLAAAMAVALLALARTGGSFAPAALVGIAAWLSFALLSSVDWVAHFPQVVVVTALLIGLTVSDATE